jgi:Zn-finger nucleic acid-binding protein
MIGVALSDRAEINVDVCQHCHFIWFDVHELDTLVPRQPEPAPVAGEMPQKAPGSIVATVVAKPLEHQVGW